MASLKQTGEKASLALLDYSTKLGWMRRLVDSWALGGRKIR